MCGLLDDLGDSVYALTGVLICTVVVLAVVLTLPTTPRPRTVSRVPERLNILQCLSLSWTTSLPMFSRRMQYRHCGARYRF